MRASLESLRGSFLYLYFPSPPKIITWGAALSLVVYLYSLRRVARSRPHVTVVQTALGHELSGVPIVRVPRCPDRTKRTRIGVALGLRIEDGVDSTRCATVADSDHDCVLVGADDVSDVV